MSGRNALLRWLVDPEPPGLGLDLRSGELALVQLADKRGTPELGQCTTAPLPAGLVAFSMLEPNIRNEKALREVLEGVFLRTGMAGAHRIALTLPDYVTRISVQELPDAPRARGELTELLKFQLKRSLPFDISEARIAFERLPAETPSFLTGVMHEAVASQFESFFAELGLHLGHIAPSSLSMLALLNPVAQKELAPGADYFFVNVEREYFNVSLVRERVRPALTRTLGLRANGDSGVVYDEDDLLQEIISTALYYREKLRGETLERVYYRSLRPDLTNLRELLEDQFEAPTEPFNLMKAVGVSKDVKMDAPTADAVGAAAAAALGRVA